MIGTRFYVIQVKTDEDGNWEDDALDKVKDALYHALYQDNAVPYFIVPLTTDFSVVKDLVNWVKNVARPEYGRRFTVVWAPSRDVSYSGAISYAKELRSERAIMLYPGDPVVMLDSGTEKLVDGWFIATEYAASRVGGNIGGVKYDEGVSLAFRPVMSVVRFRTLLTESQIKELEQAGVIPVGKEAHDPDTWKYLFETTTRTDDDRYRFPYAWFVLDRISYEARDAIRALRGDHRVRNLPEAIRRRIINACMYWVNTNVLQGLPSIEIAKIDVSTWMITVTNIRFRDIPYWFKINVVEPTVG